MKYSFVPNQIHVALFSNAFDLSKPLDIAQGITQATNRLFDGQPVILPVPQEAPPEIPRLVLKNINESFLCNVSKNRCDFIYKKVEESDSFDTVEELYLENLLKITSFWLKANRSNINRIGVVVTLIEQLNESSNAYIKKLFLKDALFSNSHDVQLGVLEKKKVLDFEVNSWFRVHSLHSTKDPDDDKALAVTFDVNTLSDQSYSIDEKKVESLFLAIKKQVSDSVKIYFME